MHGFVCVLRLGPVVPLGFDLDTRKLVIDGLITPEDKIKILADMLDNPGVPTSVVYR